MARQSRPGGCINHGAAIIWAAGVQLRTAVGANALAPQDRNKTGPKWAPAEP